MFDYIDIDIDITTMIQIQIKNLGQSSLHVTNWIVETLYRARPTHGPCTEPRNRSTALVLPCAGPQAEDHTSAKPLLRHYMK